MSWLDEYKKTLKIAEVEEYIDLFFYRPLAFLLVKSVYKTNITPNHLTLTALVVGIISGLLYSFGTYDTCVGAALLYGLFIVLDCSDGQLARLKQNGSPVGRILDGIADYTAATAVYIGIAVGYVHKLGEPSYMLPLMALSGASIIFQEMLVDYHRTHFIDIYKGRKDTFKIINLEFRQEYMKLKDLKGRWFEKNLIYIYLLYSNIQRKLLPKRIKSDLPAVPSEEYIRKNRILIRLWVLMGPSAVKTTLIVCSLLNRFDIYFWITIAGLNLFAILMLIIQKLVDDSYSVKTVGIKTN
jgi:phosphatidylglycerophosphate synthase